MEAPRSPGRELNLARGREPFGSSSSRFLVEHRCTPRLAGAALRASRSRRHAPGRNRSPGAWIPGLRRSAALGPGPGSFNQDPSGTDQSCCVASYLGDSFAAHEAHPLAGLLDFLALMHPGPLCIPEARLEDWHRPTLVRVRLQPLSDAVKTLPLAGRNRHFELHLRFRRQDRVAFRNPRSIRSKTLARLQLVTLPRLSR